jgi:hypothetical protein
VFGFFPSESACHLPFSPPSSSPYPSDLSAALVCRSPRWLFVHGHYEAASQIVADLNDQDLEDEDTQRQIRIIVEGINASAGAAAGVTMKELFVGGKKQHFRRMAVGASSQIFQQLGGCNAVIYYATVLFEDSIGLTSTYRPLTLHWCTV